VDQAARDARPGQAFIQRFKDGLGLSQDDIVIGILGYVSAYKGHLDAIKALQLLPPNYKLMIFGRQHPQTIKNSGEIDAYMGLLLKWIFKLKIKDRVFFMGELPEAEFLDIAEQLDVTILPYYENGQDGSGIASICMDMSKKVVCSTSFAFDELFKLISYKNVYRFDIGNYLDLAQKILAASRSDRQVTRERSEYSIQSQAQLYIKSFGLPSVVPDPKLVATATAERVS
jgi:glycosyltransferase involved in cell wall biosynthesis